MNEDEATEHAISLGWTGHPLVKSRWPNAYNTSTLHKENTLRGTTAKVVLITCNLQKTIFVYIPNVHLFSVISISE